MARVQATFDEQKALQEEMFGQIEALDAIRAQLEAQLTGGKRRGRCLRHLSWRRWPAPEAAAEAAAVSAASELEAMASATSAPSELEAMASAKAEAEAAAEAAAASAASELEAMVSAKAEAEADASAKAEEAASES